MILETGLISQLVGLAGGLGSAIVGYWQSRENNRHEAEMTDKNNAHALAMAEHQKQAEIAIHEVKATDQEHERTITHSTKLQGVRSWIRPGITIASFGTALIIAVLIITGAIDPTTWTVVAQDALAWLFGIANVVVGFWFGPRLFQKLMEWRVRRY